jgi:hypothetical protein
LTTNFKPQAQPQAELAPRMRDVGVSPEISIPVPLAEEATRYSANSLILAQKSAPS